MNGGDRRRGGGGGGSHKGKNDDPFSIDIMPSLLLSFSPASLSSIFLVDNADNDSARWNVAVFRKGSFRGKTSAATGVVDLYSPTFLLHHSRSLFDRLRGTQRSVLSDGRFYDRRSSARFLGKIAFHESCVVDGSFLTLSNEEITDMKN